MASLPLPRYHVFISFRGQDTRHDFMPHLSDAFRQRGIDAFDDEKLPRGNDISRLLEQIEKSKVATIVLSENYANSPWCLFELEKIMGRHEKGEMEVVPIFYKVTPSDVRYQTGSFGAPFERAEETFGGSAHKVPIWKNALKQVSDVAGYVVVSAESREPDVIKNIVENVEEMLPSAEIQGLVGIERHVEKLERLLRFDEGSKVRTVGILGMVGIGKTTIAQILFQRKRNRFTGRGFFEDIRDNVDKIGLTQLQTNILREILGDEKLKVEGASETAHESLKNRLGNKKVLIVLDNVTDKKQIDLLMGLPEWYGEGTRIIITTRDRKLTENVVDETYEVPRLDDKEALQLFSLHAFPNNLIPESGFRNAANEFLDYAKGNPWIIKLLGKDLLKKDIDYWKDKLGKVKRIPDGEFEGLLRVILDELKSEQKIVFLDVACFFRSENVNYVQSLLHDDDINASCVISDLSSKFLISIADNHIEMHDLLYIMGKHIGLQKDVRNPGRRCRLWNQEDICHVLHNGTGTEETRGIFLDMHEAKRMNLQPNVFERMHHLKFLKIYNSRCARGCKSDCEFYFRKGLSSLPDALTYLHWQGFPLENLPSGFNPCKLVDVNLSYSNITSPWEDDNKNIQTLKWMDLSFSQNLLSLSGLSNATNLESLNLEDCVSLSNISSITNMHALVRLNLRGCTGLKRLPKGINLKSLKILVLSGCNNLKRFRLVSERIENLFLDGTAVRELPESIGKLDKLTLLNLKNCNKLKCLPESLCKLTSLEELVLSGCSRLESFPGIQKGMERLEILLLEETAIKKMPETLCLSNLKTFSFRRSRGQDSVGLLLPSLLSSCLLTDLYLTDCGLHQLPDNVSFLSSLRCLCLSRNDFQALPTNIMELSFLKWLDLSYCKQLHTLPVLPPDLQYLDAHDCKSLETFGSPLKLFKAAKQTHSTFIFSNCFHLCEIARCSIVFHTQVISQLMANASLRRYHRGIILEPLISICYPGSEIPLWFQHKGRGHRTETMLPPHWCDSRFLGFALCAVVSFKDEYDHSARFSLRCRCKITTEGEETISFNFTLGGWNELWGSSEEPRELGSDHVFLSYNNCFHVKKCRGEENLNRCSHSKATFRFFVTDDTKNKTERCEVVKFGLNLLHAKDKSDGASTDHEVIESEQRQHGKVIDEAGCSEIRCGIDAEQGPRKAMRVS